MTTVPVAQIIAGLKIASAYDFEGAVAAFEGQDTETKVIDGLIALDDAAKIAGLFFPPAAVFANDLDIAISVEPIVKQLILWMARLPALKSDPNAPEAFYITDGTTF